LLVPIYKPDEDCNTILKGWRQLYLNTALDPAFIDEALVERDIRLAKANDEKMAAAVAAAIAATAAGADLAAAAVAASVAATDVNASALLHDAELVSAIEAEYHASFVPIVAAPKPSSTGKKRHSRADSRTIAAMAKRRCGAEVAATGAASDLPVSTYRWRCDAP
jgi:hypothetical protein